MNVYKVIEKQFVFQNSIGQDNHFMVLIIIEEKHTKTQKKCIDDVSKEVDSIESDFELIFVTEFQPEMDLFVFFC